MKTKRDVTVVEKISYSLPVDAGSICVASVEWLEKKYGISVTEDKEKGGYFKIEKFTGAFSIQLKTSLYFDKESSKTIKSSKGFYVGDLCYVITDNVKWLNLLQDTDYLQNIPQEFGLLSNNTGGDGMVKIEITFTKIIGE